MNATKPQDVFNINPAAMGIVNRLASGCTCIGHHQFQGGLLVQGSLGGQARIDGDLVLWSGGLLEGTIDVIGDFYLVGQLGREEAAKGSTLMRVRGTVYAASSCISFATIYGKNLHLYDGAQIFGPFMTWNAEQQGEGEPTLSPDLASMSFAVR